MKKKITAILLALAMIISVLPTSVLAVNYDEITDPVVDFILSPNNSSPCPGDKVSYTLYVSYREIYLSGFAVTLSLPEGLTFVASSGKVAQSAQEKLNFDMLIWTESSKIIGGFTAEPVAQADTSPIEIMSFDVTVDENVTA